jgi:glucose/mannose-6-phosphate isomerase
MRELALQLPQQLRDGYKAGRGLDASVRADLHSATLVGMGGSAIAGDLAAVLTDPETELGLHVVRSPDLPRSISHQDLVLVASYSGNTWETLSAYDEAGRHHRPRLVITSGGRLAERAADDGVPCLLLPPGGPPRSWVGFTLGGLFGLLDPIFPESNEDRLRHAVDTLEARLSSYASPQGAPARWAAAVDRRQPLVYAETGFSGLARRWKTQIEENAKRGAGFDILPELFHNAVVAWDAARPEEGRNRAVLQLEWSEASPETRLRYRYLERLLAARRIPLLRVPLVAPDRLLALFTGLALGDFFSLALAARSGVDPFPVDAITRMKTELERPVRRTPVARRKTRSRRR